MTRKTIKERIEKLSEKDKESGCWNWIGAMKCDYGSITINKRSVLAHRASYQAFNGELPEGAYVMHKCDNKLCVNPEHLEAGNHSQNQKDAYKRGQRKIPNGELNPYSKLTDEQVRVIKDSSLDNQELADMFNVCRGTIFAIRSGRTWKHVCI